MQICCSGATFFYKKKLCGIADMQLQSNISLKSCGYEVAEENPLCCGPAENLSLPTSVQRILHQTYQFNNSDFSLQTF